MCAALLGPPSVYWRQLSVSRSALPPLVVAVPVAVAVDQGTLSCLVKREVVNSCLFEILECDRGGLVIYSIVAGPDPTSSSPTSRPETLDAHH
ncbi:hypothetical protein B0T18DRAFT_207453 [Schizothecium vesticola]|uniref:Uncharacterized protein n=1 Tax=Schizothecium vesticola TaxID=314040 RepID=A0AA40EJ89_9PEZI|nr:hypothetical protein B0T18DRAFT_207453 [Schizothecium vesticola]